MSTKNLCTLFYRVWSVSIIVAKLLFNNNKTAQLIKNSHGSLLTVTRRFTVDAVCVDFFLEQFLHFVRLRDVDGKLAVVVHRRHVGAVVKQVSETSDDVIRDQKVFKTYYDLIENGVQLNDIYQSIMIYNQCAMYISQCIQSKVQTEMVYRFTK